MAAVPAPVKKKRNLPKTPGLCVSATVASMLVCVRTAATPSAPVFSDGLLAWPLPPVADPGDCALAEDTAVHEPLRVQGVRQGLLAELVLQLHRRGHNLP